MALSLRLRRALTLSSSILKDRHFSSISSSPPLSPAKPYSPLIGNPISRPHFLIQAQSFRSSPVSFNRRFDQKEPEIGPDDILFEGCDYNHWLITVDFPKDPAPTAEEMVETYVQTAAKVFGSVEEAKKRMYACSTTTYHGFQCLCDEATSEKFRGLPGVVFILPDSYIDPVNKEYGGDKYENGVITPRPPPIQYGRQGRYGDRNRNYDQPRYNRPRDSNPVQQGSTPQDGRGFGPPRQDGRGFGPPPQDGRGFGPPPQDGRGFGPPPQDGRGFGPPPQDGRGFGPPPQDGRGFGPPRQEGRGFGPPPQDGRGFGPPPQDGRGFGPPPQDGRGYGQGERRDYAQVSRTEYAAGGRDGYQGERRDQMPPYQSGFHQGHQGSLPPQEQRNFSQGPGGDYRPGSAGDYRQSSGPGFGGEPRQGPGTGYNGDNRQRTESGHAEDYRQGPGLGHGQSSTGPVEGQWQGKY